MCVEITVDFLDSMICRNRGLLRNLPKDKILKKPERDSLMKLQRKIFDATRAIKDKKIHQKIREFNVSCDRLIYKKKIK